MWHVLLESGVDLSCLFATAEGRLLNSCSLLLQLNLVWFNVQLGIDFSNHDPASATMRNFINAVESRINKRLAEQVASLRFRLANMSPTDKAAADQADKAAADKVRTRPLQTRPLRTRPLQKFPLRAPLIRGKTKDRTDTHRHIRF